MLYYKDYCKIHFKKNNAIITPPLITKKAPKAIDNDSRIFFELEMSGKWLYPSYALTNAAIAAIIPNSIPNVSTRSNILSCTIVFIISIINTFL